MSIISITSDYGNKDFTKGYLKGLLHSQLENPIIVDISHEVSPFNILEASYIIKNSYKSFPRGTIHIIDVDADKTPEQELIVAIFDEHYFVTANNGILSLISEELRNTNMLFLTAGLGGGTGTGALPVIASIAKKLEIRRILKSYQINFINASHEFMGVMLPRQHCSKSTWRNNPN